MAVVTLRSAAGGGYLRGEGSLRGIPATVPGVITGSSAAIAAVIGASALPGLVAGLSAPDVLVTGSA